MSSIRMRYRPCALRSRFMAWGVPRCGLSITRSCVSDAARSARYSRVPSVEAPSATTTSKCSSSSCASTASSVASIRLRSFRTGITIDTSGMGVVTPGSSSEAIITYLSAENASALSASCDKTAVIVGVSRAVAGSGCTSRGLEGPAVGERHPHRLRPHDVAMGGEEPRVARLERHDLAVVRLQHRQVVSRRRCRGP